MLLIALSCKLPLLNFPRYPFNSRFFWSAFSVIYLAFNLTLLVTYRGALHLSSFMEIYAFRHQSGEVIEQNPFVGYIAQALANVLNPLLIAYGLAFRRKRYVLLGTLGEIYVYSAVVTKISILSTILIAAIFYSIKKDRGGLVPKLGLFIAGVFFALTTLVIGAKPGVLFNVASIGLVRSFAIPGMLVGQYQYFFENEPHTYLGTVKIINLFVSNPYTLSLGMEVGAFYGGKENSERGRVNENANLFATDGIAAFGLPGILMSGALCAAVFWVLDSCAQGYAVGFSVAALTMVIISFTNVSLFTTVLGNGLMTWMLLFVFMPCSFLDANVRAHGSPDAHDEQNSRGAFYHLGAEVQGPSTPVIESDSSESV
jgi:hypothetical protein